LTEGALRSAGGAITNPSADHVVPLAETFGVQPSYLFDKGTKPLIIGQEAVGIFRDETGSAIDRNSLHLPERERQMILGIIQQFEDMQRNDDDHGATP
jgi:hypothetical protein